MTGCMCCSTACTTHNVRETSKTFLTMEQHRSTPTEQSGLGVLVGCHDLLVILIVCSLHCSALFQKLCQAVSCVLLPGHARPLVSVPVWHWSAANMQVRLVGQSQAQPAGRSEVRQRVLNTPMPGGGTMQTPMPPGWKNAEFGGAFATVVRKAGRGAKTKAGSAIVITCAGTSCSQCMHATCLCDGCHPASHPIFSSCFSAFWLDYCWLHI